MDAAIVLVPNLGQVSIGIWHHLEIRRLGNAIAAAGHRLGLVDDSLGDNIIPFFMCGSDQPLSKTIQAICQKYALRLPGGPRTPPKHGRVLLLNGVRRGGAINAPHDDDFKEVAADQRKIGPAGKICRP